MAREPHPRDHHPEFGRDYHKYMVHCEVYRLIDLIGYQRTAAFLRELAQELMPLNGAPPD